MNGKIGGGVVLISMLWSIFGGCLLSAQDEQVYSYLIGKVTIDRQPVFLTDTSSAINLLYTTANRLHILTRARIIRNELLFSEGDIYVHELVEETERNLRRLDIIGDVFIRRDTVGAHTIDLAVHTRDRWSLELGGSYKQEGGIRTSRITLQEHNFFGGAQRFKVSFNRRSDRMTPDGLDISFHDPRLFGSWWKSLIKYQRAEELELRSISLNRTYHTEATTWAAGVYTDQRSMEHYFYDNGIRDSTFSLSRSNQSAWFSISSGTVRKLRSSAALVRVRTPSSELPSRPYDNLDLVILSLSPRRRIYYKERYLNNFGRVEDIPVGYFFDILVGRNFYHHSPNTPDYYFRLNSEYALKIRRKYYLGYRAALSSFLVEGEHKDLILGLEVLHYHRLSTWHTLAARLKGIYGHNWSPFHQLVLGAPGGLRGYPAYALNGQRLLLLNVEDRIFTPLELWIYRLGGVLFFDMGAVWGETETFSVDKLHPAFGIGLRIENSVQQGSGIMRIDFAFRPDGGLSEVSITAGQLFKAFTNMTFIPPNIIK
ncbi:MAG: hypothetical protein JSU77_01115 [Fidelibacterota bacterium]|nr:MAG: hypothetical protein JSU77_01115 [Candidatus Neomarinimicrobiota bacterium]